MNTIAFFSVRVQSRWRRNTTVATSETLVGNKETAEHRTGSMRDTFTVLLSD